MSNVRYYIFYSQLSHNNDVTIILLKKKKKKIQTVG
jgi:hypothetical protein